MKGFEGNFYLARGRAVYSRNGAVTEWVIQSDMHFGGSL